ncbi:hypothetical protein MAR_012522, partial [Mya arenaria]
MNSDTLIPIPNRNVITSFTELQTNKECFIDMETTIFNRTIVYNRRTLLDVLKTTTPDRGVITVSNHYSFIDDPLIWGKVNTTKEHMRLKWGVGRLVAEADKTPLIEIRKAVTDDIQVKLRQLRSKAEKLHSTRIKQDQAFNTNSRAMTSQEDSDKDLN